MHVSPEAQVAGNRIAPEHAYLQLADHPRWVVERHRLYRDLRFPTFMNAIAFINRVAEIAERQDHHPNIHLHEWCFVRLDLYSHIDDALSQKDVDLAIAIDEIAGDA